MSIAAWRVRATFVDSAGRVEQHMSGVDFTVITGTAEQAIQMVRDFRTKIQIESVEHQRLGIILGLDEPLESLARAQFPDHLIMSQECRLEAHVGCYGSVYGVAPDGRFSRPCECPCHTTKKEKKNA